MKIEDKLYNIVDRVSLLMEDETIYGDEITSQILENYDSIQHGIRLMKISDRPEESREFVLDEENYMLLSETFEENSYWLTAEENYNPYSDNSFVQMEYLMCKTYLEKVIEEIGFETSSEYRISKEIINEIKSRLNGEYDEDMSKDFNVEEYNLENNEGRDSYINPEINF